MSISYEKLHRHRIIFLRLTGLSIYAFSELLKKLSPAWIKIEALKKCMGRRSTGHISRTSF